MTTLVLLGTQPRVILPVLRAACFGGHRAIVVGPASTRGLRWSTSCSRHVLCDLAQTQQAGTLLRALARENDAVVVPCDCDGIRLLHRLADGGLPTIPMPAPVTLAVLDDKWLFHQLCVAQGLPVPATAHHESRDGLAFEEIALQVGLPFVVKPTCESGSRGVVVVRTTNDLRKNVLDAPHYPAGPVIAQRFIAGEDIDADLLAVRGELRVLTTHRVRGHWMDFGRHEELEEIAAAVCRATAFSGPMNIDARLERRTGRVFLVEANPRFWASADMALAAGLDFLAASIDPPPVLERLAPTRVNRRHPLLRPRDWPRLLAGDTPDARLACTVLRDPHAAASLAGAVPAMAVRRLAALAHHVGRHGAPALPHAPVPWHDTAV